MSSDFQQDKQFNPYQSNPETFDPQPPFNKAKVQAPAIALIVCGGLSFIASIYGAVNALVSQVPPIPPDAPELVAQILKGTVGPMAAAIQTVFILVGLFILFGGIQMLRLKTWAVALAATIVSMLNFGSCCCLIGMPIGIWALVILLMGDVKRAFELSSRGLSSMFKY